MRTWLAFSCWIIAIALTTAVSADAHTRSESHAVWELNGGDINLVMTIPVVEAQRVSPDGSAPSDEIMTRYLTERVYPIAGGKRCAIIPPVETLSAAPGFRRYDFTFHCPTGDHLQIRSAAFFDLVPSHMNFAQIQNVASGEFSEQLITDERQTVDMSNEEGSRLQQASFFEFVGMGTMHIFTGVDHMSFLLGLVLISRRLRDLVFVVTGFTLGHSLTLALAVTGVIRPHAEYIDALVALTIALIGAENIAVQTRRPGVVAAFLAGSLGAMALGRLLGLGGDLPTLLVVGAALFSANYLMISGNLRDAGRLRMVITLVFGLIHGFGFAADLLELQLPPKRLAELLVGFNVGVEIGQLTLVVGATLLVALLSKLKLSLPRPIVVDLASAFLVGIGVFWFVTRSYA